MRLMPFRQTHSIASPLCSRYHCRNRSPRLMLRGKGEQKAQDRGSKPRDWTLPAARGWRQHTRSWRTCFCAICCTSWSTIVTANRQPSRLPTERTMLRCTNTNRCQNPARHSSRRRELMGLTMLETVTSTRALAFGSRHRDRLRTTNSKTRPRRNGLQIILVV